MPDFRAHKRLANFLVTASINGASREQISLLAGDQVTASSRSPGSFRVSTKKSKNGATIGNLLKPGKFCLADDRVRNLY
ncbi:hypothetical protein [Microcoleus sp. D3_18a_C4]|uniref:hypothetical protein n=1 Tax=Microcoleus sp. D3_18a_C4 TaxID=3055332 RepID=UPI002FD0473C